MLKTHLSKLSTKSAVRHFEVSNPITSGNSGGPAFDEDWNLIGMAKKGPVIEKNSEGGMLGESLCITLEEIIKCHKIND